MFFTFENGFYLYFFLLTPVLIFLHFFKIRNPKSSSLKIANFDAIAKIKGIDLYSKNIVYFFINLLIFIVVVLSLSGLTLHKEMNASSFSYVIAIDSSQSMGADDISPNRLTYAKKASVEFIGALPYESRVGVLSFSGNTYIHQDLTKDKLVLKDSIGEIEMTSFGGTDIVEVITIALNILKNEESKAIILLSDGQINVKNIDVILSLAMEKDTIVHTIGIGTIKGGNADFGISKLDEDMLKSLAYNTGGKFFKVGNNEELVESFKKIIPLTRKMGSINLSPYLLILLLILFVVSQFYNNYKSISL